MSQESVNWVPAMQVYLNSIDNDSVISNTIFERKRSILFSVVCPFNPECTKQLLEYEKYFADGYFEPYITDVFCISTSDQYIMDAWFKQNNIKHVKYIADGNAGFTTAMMKKTYHVFDGLGLRSTKYSCAIFDNVIEHILEPLRGINDTEVFDYTETSPEKMATYLSDEYTR